MSGMARTQGERMDRTELRQHYQDEARRYERLHAEKAAMLAEVNQRARYQGACPEERNRLQVKAYEGWEALHPLRSRPRPPFILAGLIRDLDRDE